MKTLNTSALVTADSPKGQRTTETFRAQYNKAGLNDESAQRLNEHPGFAVHLAEGIRRFGAEAPDYGLAQSILGADFITPEEVNKARPSIFYTDKQITALAKSLPPLDVLKCCKDNGYPVMPAPPTAISTLNIWEMEPLHFHSEMGGWYADQKFAREDKTSFGWLAINKTPVSNSTSKNWNEQNKLLSALDHVPNAAEMNWFIKTYFKVRGIRLFKDVYVRTSSFDSDGNHVNVGGFDSEGLYVGCYWRDVSRVDVLGVSAGRKF